MKLKTTAIIAGAMLSSGVVQAADAVAMSAPQKKEVEVIVHDYLVNHPEVLLEASQALQKKQQDDMQQVAQSAIRTNASDLFRSDGAYTGNPKGDVTIVEFFDYQCVHCKRMTPILSELTSKNPKLKVVYKELPIFGKRSETASRAALAAAKQGKYKEMHEALLKIEKRLNDQLVMQTAQSVGLDMDKLKADMKSKAVDEELALNQALAEKLNLMGTPAFILAATPDGELDAKRDPAFIPGAATLEALQDLVTQANKS